ncbi:HAD family phosphatase [Methylophilaceae bacterium]|nr:HAD family phosphatase [Methylophilaceae bacterium]
MKEPIHKFNKGTFLQLAIFDLDNTLLNGDSDYNWSLFLIEHGVLDSDLYKERNEQFFKEYQSGNLDVFAYCEFQFKTLKDNPRELLDELRSDYVKKIINPMITKEAKDLVESHRKENHKLLIITATNSYITRPIADLFGIEDLIGTDLEELNGEFTGKVSGLPSFQEGKIIRLNSWLEKRGLIFEELEKTFFYSDSMNDIPLLEKVSNPVAANPDEILEKKATKENWPIIYLR